MRVIIDLLKSILDKVKTISEGGGGGGGSASAGDLIDTVWRFNDTLVAGDLNYPTTLYLDVNGFGAMECVFANINGNIVISYDGQTVYENGAWADEEFKTWWIAGGVDAYDNEDFANWLKLNATQAKKHAFGTWKFNNLPTYGDLELPAAFSVYCSGNNGIEITSDGGAGVGTITLTNSNDPDNPVVIYDAEHYGWENGQIFMFTGGDDITNPEFIAWLHNAATRIPLPHYSGYDLVYRVDSTAIDDIINATLMKGSFAKVKEKFALGDTVNAAVLACEFDGDDLESARMYCVQNTEFSIYDGDEQIVTNFTAATMGYPSKYTASSSGGTVNNKVSLFGAEANVAKPLRAITLTADGSAFVY